LRILVNDVLDGLGLVPDKDFKQIILDRAAQGPKRVLDGEARALWGAGTIPQLSEFLASPAADAKSPAFNGNVSHDSCVILQPNNF